MSLLGACLKSRRLRWLAVFFTAGMIALAIADYCFETRGLPEFVRRKIEQRVERYGFRLSMKSCRAGLWNGIVGTGVQMTGGKGQPEFAASRVQIEFLPFRIFQGVFLPFAIRIEEGTAAFPLFPESGAEGIHDRLVISGVNASLSGAPGIIEVTRADGMLNGIRFTMHGTVDNLLHYSGAKWVDELRESLESGSEEPENQPEAESGVPETVSVPESAYDSFIRSVPLALRRKVLYTLQRVYAKQFRQEPSCNVQFHLDITDFAKSTAKASFDIPAFRYGGLQIESIREETSLKDGIIRLDQVRIDLGSGNFIIADGTYDGTGNAATGQVRGRCRIADLILFLDASLQEEIGAMVDIRNEIVTFEGSLEDFKLSSRNYYGKLHVRLPHLNIHRLQLDDVSLSVVVKGRVWEGSLLNASLRNGGSIQGQFRLDDERFDARLDGTANSGDLHRILSPEISTLIRENVRLKSPASRNGISFQGKLGFPLHRIPDLSGEFRVRLTDLLVKNVALNSLTSTVNFTTSSIRVRDMEALLPDGSRVTGRLFCEPAARYISASVVCSGSPGYMIEALGKSHKDFVTSLTRDIRWPTAANTVEISADLYADYGSEPFYFLSGSMVIRDFAYQNIPFRYGAARFMIDAENRLILPDVILETAEGKMRMSADYKPSGRDLSFSKPDGILNFQLSSSIVGNDMIRSLYPEWKSEYVDFPFPMQVEARGEINYLEDRKTHFEATISNGSCRWQGIRIDDLDTTLHYADNTVSFRGGEAHFSGGRLQMDYLYNFNTETGKVSARLTSANLLSLLENFKIKAGEEYRNAALSMNFDADMSYGAAGALHLNGGGSMTVEGNNLWTVPILGSFLRIIGQAWSLESFGSITKISGDFKLKQDRLEFDGLRSNGGLVSLNAFGLYHWQDNSFDVRVRAELLRNTLPFDAMSRLLSPVSWILERRLQGNFSTYKWE